MKGTLLFGNVPLQHKKLLNFKIVCFIISRIQCKEVLL